MKVYNANKASIKAVLRSVLKAFERPLVSIPFEFQDQLYQEVLIMGTFPGLDRATPKGILYLDASGGIESKSVNALIEHLWNISWIYNIDFPDDDFSTVMRTLVRFKQDAWNKSQIALRFLQQQKGHTEPETLIALLTQSQGLEIGMLNSLIEKEDIVTHHVAHLGYVDSSVMAGLAMDEYWLAIHKLHCLYHDLSVLWQQVIPLAKRNNSLWLRLSRPSVSSALDFILINDSTYDPEIYTKVPFEEFITERKHLHRERRLKLLRAGN